MPNPFEVSAADNPSSNSLPPGTRPPSATVFGILNLVFGVLGICGSIASAGFLFASANPDWNLTEAPGMEQFRDATYRAFLTGMSVIAFVLVLALIGSGIGLLKFKPWGRTLAIWYAIPQIFYVIANSVGSFVLVILPNLARASSPEEQMGAYIGVGSSIVGALFALLYPVLLLIFMNRQKFKDAINA